MSDECKDNWGMTYQERQPFNPTSYEEEVLPLCKDFFASMGPASDTLSEVMATHYPNTAKFSEFKGKDLIPENHDYFPAWPNKWGPKLTTRGSIKKAMKGGTCEKSSTKNDGSQWTVTRLGPFKTTGGYDWTQVGWEDLWSIESKLKIHKEGIFVLEQLSVPVLADGTRLGNPPIHVHHIHVGPRPGTRQHTNIFSCMGGKPSACYDATRMFEHRGDYQPTEGKGGLNGLSETVPDGYGKLVTIPIGLEGDINDVRAPNSDVLEWYYEFGIRWIPNNEETRKTIKPMHFHNFAGPGDFKVNDQKPYIFTYQAPTDHDSLFWYSGRMPYDGKMLRNKGHIHNKITKEALFFAASPNEIGLINDLVPKQPYLTVDINKAGYNSLDALKSQLLKNVESAGKTWDKLKNSGSLPSFWY